MVSLQSGIGAVDKGPDRARDPGRECRGGLHVGGTLAGTQGAGSQGRCRRVPETIGAG